MATMPRRAQRRTARIHHSPPDLDVLNEAADTLRRSGYRSEIGAALLAAALPDGQLIGVHAHSVDGELRWRGVTVDGTGPADVAALLADGAAPSDTWTWPTGHEPQRWVRHITSGTRVVAWGSRSILGGPRVTFECSLTDPQRDAVLDHVAAGTRAGNLEQFAVLDTPDGAVLCSGSTQWCHATHAADGPDVPADERSPDPTEVRFAAAELVRGVAGAAVAGVVEGEDPNRFEVHVTTGDGAHLCVPVQVRGDGTTAVGATVIGIAPPEGIAPDGWELAGVGEDHSWVVTRGGICAQVR